MKRLALGFSYAFRGLSYLSKNSKLWSLSALPALLNAALFVLGTWAYVHYFPDLLHRIMERPEIWYLWIVYVLIILMLIIVYALVVIFSFTAVGCALAAPFLDLLSEKVEKLEGRIEPSQGWGQILHDAARGMLTSLVIFALFLVTQMALLLLWLIPVAGKVIYLVLSPLCGSFFLAFQFFDLPLNRRRLSPREKIKYLLRHKSEAVGFGLAVYITTLIPLLNFFLLPAATTGATLLIRQMEGTEDHAPVSG